MNPQLATRNSQLVTLLLPFGYLYGQVMRLRSMLYEFGLFKTRSLPCRVISIGNLTLGGTGKTPLTIWLARYLQGKGKRVAIVSRGYKAKNKGPVSIVSDGQSTLLGPDEAGDEPFMMARNLPGVPLLIGKERFLVGMRAIEDFSPDVVLLDDGYQHLGLTRDLNLLLLRTVKPFGNGRVFPAGTLRESLSALKRADAFILTYAEEEAGSVMEEQRLFLQERFPNKPVFVSHCKPNSFYFLNGGETLTSSELMGRKTLAFCGIAHPESFRKTLIHLGVDLVDFMAYRDHYDYHKGDLEEIEEKAAGKGAEYIITTEKDAVKIDKLIGSKIPIGVLRTEFIFESDFEAFINKSLL